MAIPLFGSCQCVYKILFKLSRVVEPFGDFYSFTCLDQRKMTFGKRMGWSLLYLSVWQELSKRFKQYGHFRYLTTRTYRWIPRSTFQYLIVQMPSGSNILWLYFISSRIIGKRTHLEVRLPFSKRETTLILIEGLLCKGNNLLLLGAHCYRTE